MVAVLSEYGWVDMDLTRSQAEALQLTGRVSVSPAPAGQWRVTASSYVGTLVVEGVELLVRPKINPENLFLLLEPGVPVGAWREEAFDYGASSNLLPSVIAFFARTVETTLGRGVLRSYRVREEALVALRGRLNVSGQFARAGVLTPTACTYDDFSEDVIENQVLRAAIRRALRVPRIDVRERQRLMRQLVALDGVSDAAVHPETVDTITFSRLNEHYSSALGLARLILSNLTLADTRGSITASSFMVDMNDLFQRFVTARLRHALRGRLDVIAEPQVRLGTGGRISMRPDLVFRHPGGGECYVGDIKYKITDTAVASTSDYYQLLAYTTAMNLPEGVLIYCRGEGDVNQQSVVVKNAEKRLVVHALNLAGTPENVEREIDELAAMIASTSG